MAKLTGQQKRKFRIRNKVSGTAVRPRLSVFRSAKHMYAQVINDVDGVTVAAASTLSTDLKSADGDKTNAAKQVGALIAKACKDKSVDSVVFDRNGFLYHGRVKALAEGAREAGLEF